jgi:signal transduction histidine kinase
MSEAERARNGAVLAGTIYRNLTATMAARDDYVNSGPLEREGHSGRFTESANRGLGDLKTLSEVVRDPSHKAAAAAATDTFVRYVGRMDELMQATVSNDALIFEMGTRATTLISLAEQARKRQQESNATLVTELSDGDRKLRVVRDFVDRAQELNAAIAAVELQKAATRDLADASQEQRVGRQRLAFDMARLRNAAADLAKSLRQSGREASAAELEQLAAAYASGESVPSRLSVGSGASAPKSPEETLRAGQRLSEWTDRLIKINSTEQRAIHEEVAELLTYSVEAHETEQATQNIAISTLKLSSRAQEALARRDAGAAEAIMRESEALSAEVAKLPISPLIQSDMIDAIDQWRSGLKTTTDGLLRQQELLADMDVAAQRMIDGARSLNTLLTENAETIGAAIRNILVFGAAVGLLLGGVTGLAVARSITGPLRRLQLGMMQLAANSHAGPIADTQRRDEIGDMARATNIFVTEIRRREQALQRAKDRADSALEELQKTQSDLIQAEKLASLGQLVAGVAHEINTPLGIALTTSTLISDEVKQFGQAAESGKLSRVAFHRFVERMGEGAQLLFSNLTRAADLVHSFKQVAADQASGERRRFDMLTWLHDLLTSMRPVMRKSGHDIVIECRPDLQVDTYPGALGQVLTNLLMNSVAHAYPEGRTGRLSVEVSEPSAETVRIVFSDDGRGIPPENIGKVFDPFFTTGRSSGSTGLGLHIVYNLVTSHLMGRIELDSAPGRGTRFTIDLPKVVSADQQKDAERPVARIAGARG